MRRRIKGIMAAVIFGTLLLSGCGATENKQEATTEVDNTENTEKTETKESKNTDEDERIYEALFDINNKVSFDIDISEEELKNLQADYDEYSKKGGKSPTYRNCNVTIKIESEDGTDTYTLENVGVRMKGNTSRTAFYNEEEGIYAYTHLRLKFDKKFATLDGLEIKWNQVDDSTYMREYYALAMYKDFGVAAQKMNLTTMRFGGLYEGIFRIYEPVDENFIERYFPEEDWGGDLYKCGWTSSGADFTSNVTYGIKDEENGDYYNYDLKTNKKDSEHESLKAFLKYINGTDVTKESLEEYVDMDYFLNYSAVSYFMGDPDDLRNNYNNYYIYFLKSSGKMVVIPYDKDRCFGITKSYNPSNTAMTDVKYESERAVGNGSSQVNPLINHTITRKGLFQEEFKEKIDTVAGSKWMTLDYFKSFYEIAKNNYENDVTPDKDLKNAADNDYDFDLDKSGGLSSDSTNASFEDYITAKMKFYNETYN